MGMMEYNDYKVEVKATPDKRFDTPGLVRRNMHIFTITGKDLLRFYEECQEACAPVIRGEYTKSRESIGHWGVDSFIIRESELEAPSPSQLPWGRLELRGKLRKAVGLAEPDTSQYASAFKGLEKWAANPDTSRYASTFKGLEKWTAGVVAGDRETNGKDQKPRR